MNKMPAFRWALLALACGCSMSLQAAPGDVLFSDNFERATIAPWTTNSSTRSAILTGAQVSNSGTRGLFTRHGTVTTTSANINAGVPTAELALWVRRGSDAFSENPDGNENLVIEYRRSNGSWVTLLTYTGSGTAGQIFNDTVFMPPDGLHATLALRVRQTGGSGSDFDYFHIDDVRLTERAPQPAISVGTCDDFSAGLSANWTVAGAGAASTSSAAFQSASNSLFTNGGAVSVTSVTVDTSDPLFDSVSMWIRRGADSFSENPDGVENLVIEYLDNVGSWIVLETFVGSGTPGQTFLRSYPIPSAGRHAGFRLRIRQTSGSGAAFDFWHVDDVCFDTRNIPALRVSKVTDTVFDPVNGASNPFAIPGSIAEYTISVTNEGAGAVDANTLTVTDTLSNKTELFVDTAGGDPIVFVDGTPASGLVYSYATSVAFSSEPGGGPPFTHPPVADLDGFDSAITAIQVSFTGVMNPDTGSGPPQFQLLLRVRVR